MSCVYDFDASQLIWSSMTRFWGIPKCVCLPPAGLSMLILFRWPSKLTEMTWTNTRACGEDWLSESALLEDRVTADNRTDADDLELAASF